MSSLPGDLVRACSLGDVETLYQLLSQQPDTASLVNLTTQGDVTLLTHTIIGAGTSDSTHIGRHAECCSLLIQVGAELETADATYGRTAAHWAVYYHRDDILYLLIEASCDMTCPDYSGTSPFHLAIQESASTCLQVALQMLPREILSLPHPQFLLPLLHAVQMGKKEACQLLVEAGADVNEVEEESGRGPLHFATELNHKDLVDYLIECGGVLDLIDGRGFTPLHVASIVEGAESLEAIVRRVGGGEVLDMRDSRGLTPLMHSCLYGNIDSVRLLLKKKADASLQDSEGKTSLHYAAESSSPLAHQCLQLLLKKQRQLLEQVDGLGRTPLHLCAISGTMETLELLVTSGCPLEALDASQRGAVHWAAVSGNPRVMSRLLELGLAVDALDSLGCTPLYYACQQSAEPDPSLEGYSEEAVAKSQLVQECIGILLKGGASVTHHDAQGLLPLHSAVQLHNNMAACQLLLDSGADPEAQTEPEGLTCLHLAARVGVTECCPLLLERSGGRVGTQLDQEGRSALHHAVESAELDCVEYLLLAGLSPNTPTKNLITPAHLAAGAGLTDCLQILKGHGANFGAADWEGATPLHNAAANGHTDAVELLVSLHTASINKGAGEGQTTPLHYAVQGEHEDCVQLLLEAGAEVNALTVSEGEHLSPLDLCQSDTPIHNMLTQHGGQSGSEVTSTAQPQQDEDPSALLGDNTDGKDTHAADYATLNLTGEATISIPSLRPTTPSRRSFVNEPVFEGSSEYAAASPPQLSRVATPTLPPPTSQEALRQGPGMLKRMFSMMRKKPSQVPPDSITSSVVGFYAAQMTLLAAAIIGTPLGEKVREVSEKVATDTAQELKKTAALYEGEFPELVWLKEEVDGPLTPTPTPPPPTPPPPTPPPPIPKVTEDPYERRLRKAKAQLDMSKSPGFLAMEELLKAQDTHMKLKRQFQEERVKEAIAKRREAFKEEEFKAKMASEKAMKRFEEKLNKVKAESEVVAKGIDEQLSEVRAENEQMGVVMGAIGVNPRPTVAQWLQRKQMERKAKLQESLISWDTGRRRREAAILVEQALVSQRTMRHAAWAANKEMRSKIQVAKRSPYKVAMKLPQQQQLGGGSGSSSRGAAGTTPGDQPKALLQQGAQSVRPANPRRFRSPTDPSAQRKPAGGGHPPARSMVVPTTVGFRKIVESSPSCQQPVSKSRSAEEPLWRIGVDYVVTDRLSLPPAPPSDSYLRATGPKNVHAKRTLQFLSPQEYRATKNAEKAIRKELTQQYGSDRGRVKRKVPAVKSGMTINSLSFEAESIKRGVSFTTTPPHSAQYHSHAHTQPQPDIRETSSSSPPQQQQQQQAAGRRSNRRKMPILPMDVMELSPRSLQATSCS